MNEMEWLQFWYKSQCDGDWEHSYGVLIDTLDNPGWSVEIDLASTELRDRNFNHVKIDRTSHDWLICKKENDKFLGRGGPQNLLEIIKRFRDWCESKD